MSKNNNSNPLPQFEDLVIIEEVKNENLSFNSDQTPSSSSTTRTRDPGSSSKLKKENEQLKKKIKDLEENILTSLGLEINIRDRI